MENNAVHNDPFYPLKGLHQLEPDERLLHRIQANKYVRPLHIWVAAAMIIVLLGLQMLMKAPASDNTFTVSPSEQLYNETY